MGVGWKVLVTLVDERRDTRLLVWTFFRWCIIIDIILVTNFKCNVNVAIQVQLHCIAAPVMIESGNKHHQHWKMHRFCYVWSWNHSYKMHNSHQVWLRKRHRRRHRRKGCKVAGDWDELESMKLNLHWGITQDSYTFFMVFQFGTCIYFLFYSKFHTKEQTSYFPTERWACECQSYLLWWYKVTNIHLLVT